RRASRLTGTETIVRPARPGQRGGTTPTPRSASAGYPPVPARSRCRAPPGTGYASRPVSRTGIADRPAPTPPRRRRLRPPVAPKASSALAYPRRRPRAFRPATGPGRACCEWRAPGDQLVTERPHRVDVHAMIEVRIRGRLLRRHVRRRAERDPGGRELLAACGFAQRLGHAEVH